MRSNQYSPSPGLSTTGSYRGRNDSAQFTPDSYASSNQRSAQAPWTVASSGYIPEKIVLDADYIAKLERLVHDPVKLESHGYIMRQLSRKEIEEKGHRCGRCGKKMKERKEKPGDSNLPWKKRSGGEKLQEEDDQGEASPDTHLSAAAAKLSLNDPKDLKATPAGLEAKKEQNSKEPICKFHPGSVFHGVSVQQSVTLRLAHIPPAMVLLRQQTRRTCLHGLRQPQCSRPKCGCTSSELDLSSDSATISRPQLSTSLRSRHR